MRIPAPAAYLCALTYRDLPWAERALDGLRQIFGDAERRSAALPFDHTAYYEEEMGPGLSKFLVCFRDLRDPGDLQAVKRWTQALEGELADGLRRRVNLDPGYLTGANLILASTKGFAHRIYLGGGIYGEVTLIFRDGAFRTLPWTFPDFREEATLGFLEGCREWYLDKKKRWPAAGSGPCPPEAGPEG